MLTHYFVCEFVWQMTRKREEKKTQEKRKKIFDYISDEKIVNIVSFQIIRSRKMTGHFFEGAEKLLEIWFTTSQVENSVENDLRNIPR